MHPPPQAPYFDESRDAWVLSRYADVVAALRDSQLWPVAARGEDQAATRDELGRLRLRGPSQEALSAERVQRWQEQIQPLAHDLLDRLSKERTVDLLAEFALPWCLEFALLVVNAAAADHGRLAALGTEVFAATGAPDESPLRPRAAVATAELERLLADGPMPMSEPTFVAISQTTPRLLASIWLALYEHPDERERLGTTPELWPMAVEELLRFGGIVRRIWRQARESVEIGGARIEGGQRVMLMLARANRDPAQFPEPNRLDVTRQVGGQLALGAGRNSCIGTVLIRMCVTVATRALLERLPGSRLDGTPEWRAGSGYGFPVSLPVRL
jgi:cytochrome P450